MQEKGEGKQVESEKNKASGHLHKPLMRQLSCENEEASHRRNNKYLKSKSCTLKKKKNQTSCSHYYQFIISIYTGFKY